MIVGTNSRSQFVAMLRNSCLEPGFVREGWIEELMSGQMDKTNLWQENHRYCVWGLLFGRILGRRGILHCCGLYSSGPVLGQHCTVLYSSTCSDGVVLVC